MLYLIYGTSATKRHEARARILASLNLSAEKIILKNSSESTVAELEQVAGGASLFDDQLVLAFEYPFLNESFGQTLLDFAPQLAASENIIFVIERELTKDIVKSFEKSGAQVVLCDEAKEAKKKDFNIFSITNAFSARDKKGTWLFYREAILNEEAPEAIIGILFWSIKNMFSKRMFLKWNEAELKNASRELVRIVHEAHNGKFEIEEELERFILKSI